MNWKSILWAALPLLTVAVDGRAQGQQRPARPQPTQEQLIAQRDEKLALPVFEKAAWTFDYDVARAKAKQSGKPIFAYFSRSYAH